MPQVYRIEPKAYGVRTSSLLRMLWLAMIWRSPAQELNVKNMEPAGQVVGISSLYCAVDVSHVYARPHL